MHKTKSIPKIPKPESEIA